MVDQEKNSQIPCIRIIFDDIFVEIVDFDDFDEKIDDLFFSISRIFRRFRRFLEYFDDFDDFQIIGMQSGGTVGSLVFYSGGLIMRTTLLRTISI